LGSDNIYAQDLEALEIVYGRASNVIFILTPQDGNIFTRHGLGAIEWVTEAAWQTPYSTRVDSLANYDDSHADGDEIIIAPYFSDASALSDDRIDEIRQRALANREVTFYLVSPQAHAASVNVTVLKPEGNLGSVGEVMAFVTNLKQEFAENYPDIELRVSGGIPGDMAFDEAGNRDLATLVPLMLLVTFLSLTIGFRNIWATIGTILVVILAVASTLGAAAYSGIILTAGSAGTPVIVMTLCIADCVHLISGYGLERGRGQERSAALRASLNANFLPIFVTSLTTAIGFLSLNWSESPPLRDLGNMVAMGVLIAFLLSVTFLPAFLAIVPGMATSKPLRGQSLARWITGFSIKRGRALLAVCPIIFIAFTSGLAFLVLEDDFVGYFDDSYAFRRDTDYLQENLTGLHVIHYSLPSGEEYGITRPDYLNSVSDFADWYLAKDNVVQVSDITAVIKRLNKHIHGDDPAFEIVPETRDQAAQLFLIYELSVPVGRDLNSQIDVGKSESRLSVWLRDATSRDIRRLAEQGELWLRENAPELASPASGISVVYANITEINIRSMVRGTFVALLIISALMFGVLQSLRLGLVSLVPNLVPAAMAFGLWGYVYGEVNLAVSVVGAITLGIIVDDTVHLLMKYRRARRERPNDDRKTILHDSFSEVGLALIQTSVALVLGFVVLAQSGFAISAHMGALSAIVIMMALFADLLFLPALILAVETKKNASS
jgi:predicted RND superfamily exporter protein